MDLSKPTSEGLCEHLPAYNPAVFNMPMLQHGHMVVNILHMPQMCVFVCARACVYVCVHACMLLFNVFKSDVMRYWMEEWKQVTGRVQQMKIV